MACIRGNREKRLLYRGIVRKTSAAQWRTRLKDKGCRDDAARPSGSSLNLSRVSRALLSFRPAALASFSTWTRDARARVAYRHLADSIVSRPFLSRWHLFDSCVTVPYYSLLPPPLSTLQVAVCARVCLFNEIEYTAIRLHATSRNNPSYHASCTSPPLSLSLSLTHTHTHVTHIHSIVVSSLPPRFVFFWSPSQFLLLLLLLSFSVARSRELYIMRQGRIHRPILASHLAPAPLAPHFASSFPIIRIYRYIYRACMDISLSSFFLSHPLFLSVSSSAHANASHTRRACVMWATALIFCASLALRATCRTVCDAVVAMAISSMISTNHEKKIIQIYAESYRPHRSARLHCGWKMRPAINGDVRVCIKFPEQPV